MLEASIVVVGNQTHWFVIVGLLGKSVPSAQQTLDNIVGLLVLSSCSGFEVLGLLMTNWHVESDNS